MSKVITLWTSMPLRRRDGIAIAALTLLAIGTRFWRLGAESLWLDEAHTYFRALLPIPELIENSIQRFHNPTYFLLMHSLVQKGSSEAVLRAPSAVASVLTVPLVYATSRMATGPATGLCAGLLYLTSTAQLHYAQEARMYTMLTLCCAASIAAATWIVTHAEAAARPSFRGAASGVERQAAVFWLAYALGFASALYLHNAGAFACAGIASSLGVALVTLPNRRRLLGWWVAANLLALLLWSPWIPYLGSQQERWATPFTYGLQRLKHLQDVLAFSHKQPWRVGACVLCIASGVYQLRRQRAVALLLLGVMVSGPTLLWLVSFHKEVFELRLFLWSGLTAFVLIAAGLRMPRWPVMGVIVSVAFTLWCALDLVGYYRVFHKARWNDAAAYLLENVAQGDIVLVHGTQGKPLAYYWELVEKPPRLMMARGDLAKKTRRSTHVWHAMRSAGRAHFDLKLTQEIALFAQLETEVAFGRDVVVRRYLRKDKNKPPREPRP